MSTNKISIIPTADGSSTIINELFGQTYHSVNGAFSESLYVFIKNGFRKFSQNKISIFELGFGTGLNSALTCLEAINSKIYVDYFTIEKFPVDIETIKKMNFEVQIKQILVLIAQTSWNELVSVNDFFKIKKINDDFLTYKFEKKHDLVYFDAFSYDICPQLWTSDIFIKIYNNLNKNGTLVTYSSKGIVKENLRKAGFEVKRIPGFKKHHMLIAKKNNL